MMLDFDDIYLKYNMKINGIIHIGAHYGEEHEQYKEKNVKNLVYVEPVLKNFNVLKENIKDDSILLNIALGNEEKDIEMFVETANNGQSSSILKPKLHLVQYPDIVFNEKEIVKMKKLDNIGLDLSKYNLINIDVQGYELEVFKGGTNTLNYIDYIFCEINRDDVYENCAKVDELIKFLYKYNFDLVEINWAGYTWGDGFFIKRK